MAWSMSRPSSVILSGAQGGSNVQTTLTFLTPSTVPTASFAWNSISPVAGQPIDVSVMSTFTVVSSIRTLYTRPRFTTSIPISGSVTAFSASQTSSSLIVVSGMVLSVLRERVLQGHPRQQRALHAHGELRNALERHEVAEVLVGRLTVHHLPDRLGEPECVLHAPALDGLGHHRRGRLRDGAALPVEGDVRELAVLHVDGQVQLVAAQRVVVLHVDGALDAAPLVPRR